MIDINIHSLHGRFSLAVITFLITSSRLALADGKVQTYHFITDDKGASVTWMGDYGFNSLSVFTAPTAGPTGEAHAVLNYSIWTAQGLESGFGEIPLASFTGKTDRAGDKVVLNVDTSLLPAPGGFFFRQGNGGLIGLEWIRTDDYQIRSTGSTIRTYTCTKTRQNGQSESASAQVSGFVLGSPLPGSAQYIGADVSMSKYVVVDIDKVTCTVGVSTTK